MIPAPETPAGATMSAPVVATTCAECGAPFPKPPASSGASGYAIRPDNSRICYMCADTEQRADMRTGDTYSAYVNTDATKVTTWTGGELGRIIWKRQTRAGFKGYWNRGGLLSIRVRDVHGAEWYGRGAGTGMCIRLHRAKGRQR